MSGSVFSGVSGIKPRGDFNYIGPGNYLLNIEEFKTSKDRKGIGTVFFRLRIVDVIDPTLCVRANVLPHRVGETLSWLWKMDGDMSLPAIKRALMTLTGVAEEKITEEFCEQCASAAQPLAGMFVTYEGKQITTKKGASITDRRFVRRVGKLELQGNPVWAKACTELKLSLDNAYDPES
jgi:hypothetical protein